MSRRKKSKDTLPRTMRHLMGPPSDGKWVFQHEEWDVPSGRMPVGRLCWQHYPPITYDPIELAKVISYHNNEDIRWFCDANMFIHPTDDNIWESLLSRPERLVIIPPILNELKRWIAKPKCNSIVHDAIKRKIKNDYNSPVDILDITNNTERATVTEYYVNLIGFRKRVYGMIPEQLKEHLGREPSVQELSNFCKDQFGERTQLLAQKGRDSKVANHRYNDEALVVMAITEAIYSGKEVVIITKDEDVLEQFYKCIWLMDTHYRGMLLAKRYYDDPLYFSPSRTIEKLSEAFIDEVLLLTKPSVLLWEILPIKRTFVPINCMLIRNDQFMQSSFCAETEMAPLFRIKFATGGRNTDLFDDNNCHIWLDGLMKKVGGNYAAIGKDRCISLPQWTYSLSLLDINLALCSQEGYSHIECVDPQKLILPSYYRYPQKEK